MKQSYAHNHAVPQIGEIAWALVGYPLQPKKVVVEKVNDLPWNRAQASIVSNCGMELPLNIVFDHKPRRVKITDKYGELTVWK